MRQTLLQKVWDKHAVRKLPTGQTQLFIGLHLIHEVTSPQAFTELRQRERRVQAHEDQRHARPVARCVRGKETPIADGETGDVAVDHFHRYPEDIALLAGLGMNAYRFSISWPRVQPGGSGDFNAEGIAFYSDLVDAQNGAELPTLERSSHREFTDAEMMTAVRSTGCWSENISIRLTSATIRSTRSSPISHSPSDSSPTSS